MSQYITGTVDVTNGDATVVGTGTLFLTEVAVGDIFVRDGDVAFYMVSSVTTDLALELTGAYGGVTGLAVNYSISRDFTVPDNIPFMNQKDIHTAQIFTRAMNKIQALITASGAAAQNKFEIVIPIMSDAQAGLVVYDGLLPGRTIQVNGIGIFAQVPPTGADVIVRLLRDSVEIVGQDATLANGSANQESTLGTPQVFTAAQRLGLKFIQSGVSTPGSEIIISLHVE